MSTFLKLIFQAPVPTGQREKDQVMSAQCSRLQYRIVTPHLKIPVLYVSLEENLHSKGCYLYYAGQQMYAISISQSCC